MLSGGTTAPGIALGDYRVAWKAFLVVHHLDVLEHVAVPTTLSWKVADKTELFTSLMALGAAVEQTHIGTVNGRFIASAVLHEPYEGFAIIKLLERRAGSNDPLGLDSIDYLVKDVEAIYQLLKAAGAHVKREHNDMHAWLSLRFGTRLEYEAKFTDHLVLAVAVKEMEQAHTRLRAEYGY